MLTEEEIKLKIAYLEGYLKGMNDGWGDIAEAITRGKLEALKEVLNKTNENISVS